MTMIQGKLNLSKIMIVAKNLLFHEKTKSASRAPKPLWIIKEITFHLFWMKKVIMPSTRVSNTKNKNIIKPNWFFQIIRIDTMNRLKIMFHSDNLISSLNRMTYCPSIMVIMISKICLQIKSKVLTRMLK